MPAFQCDYEMSDGTLFNKLVELDKQDARQMMV